MDTIVNAIFKYRGVEYPIEYNFGPDYNQESALYMFEDGNYACDCNRSIFLEDHYPGVMTEVLECNSNHDNQIEMISIKISGPVLVDDFALS